MIFPKILFVHICKWDVVIFFYNSDIYVVPTEELCYNFNKLVNTGRRKEKNYVEQPRISENVVVPDSTAV